MNHLLRGRFFNGIFSLFVGFTLAACGSGGGGGGGAPPGINPAPVLSANADLAELKLSDVALSPEFDPAVADYTAESGFLLRSVKVTATAADPAATIAVNGAAAASGVSSEAIAVSEGPNTLSITVTAQNGSQKIYKVTLTRQSAASFAQQAYVKASNTGALDQFGVSVSISGDTLAVGAWAEGSNATGVNGDQTDDSAPRSGAVYLFTRDNGVWIQQAYLKASNAGADDHFGWSVSLTGDTLAVGADFEDSNATGVNGDQADDSAPRSGAVYLFTRDNGVWTQQAYLKASNAGAGDQFGWSVSLTGDTLAVAAPDEDSNAVGVNGDQADDSAPGSGAVYLFTRDNGIWTQQAYLKASNTQAVDVFGASVSLSGDTLAVGAWAEDSNATGVNGNQTDDSAQRSGAVYLFR